MMQPDARIPVTSLPDAAAMADWLGRGGPAALLTDLPPPAEGPAVVVPFTPAARHRFGCACCAGRSAAALAFDRLFVARARGESPWFVRVGVLASGPRAEAEASAALREDVLTLARFRVG